MARTSKGGAAGIPEKISKPLPAKAKAPARKRTSAFASSDPSVRERVAVGDALLVANRFQIRAKGAGMEAYDTKSDRKVAFPKASTAVVQDVLTALFGRQPRKNLPAPVSDDMPERFEVEGTGLACVRRTVRVDPLHPRNVLPAKASEGLVLQAYEVTLGGKKHGHVLVSGPNRFQVAVPRMQSKISVHTSLKAAFDRVELLAETYLARTPGRDGGASVPLIGRKA